LLKRGHGQCGVQNVSPHCAYPLQGDLRLGNDPRLPPFTVVVLAAAEARRNTLSVGRSFGILCDEISSKSMSHGIASHAGFAGRSTGTRTALRVASVRGNFGLRRYVLTSLAWLVKRPDATW
jgi:hypothetical protein